jgi:hypothetical protein
MARLGAFEVSKKLILVFQRIQVGRQNLAMAHTFFNLTDNELEPVSA